ncbi:MAG TPA: NAD(P)H-dependent glycerol-3-phosphate dehydrogenase [Aestuariivirgaceae bacterium]|jgi:glycerol-3-phosphate dehydrogenase (NAD(P)+)
MTSAPRSVAVIGAGAWGTALAETAARRGHRVRLWSRSLDTASMLNRERRHPALPLILLSSSVLATANPADLADSDLIILATPAQSARATLKLFSHCLDRPLIIAAKGIEIATGKFISEVVCEVSPRAEPYVLSGPSFAADVMMSKPTAVTLAGRLLAPAGELAALLSLPTFRIYSSDDLLGVQLGGAVKNVLAIACGIAEGRNFGDSARAALITRAFSEMLRFGHALGAERLTLTGLSGLGDLVLTCSSRQSRNFSFGIALGRNEATPEGPGESTVEGIPTSAAVMTIASDRGLDLPICRAVKMVLDGRLTVDEAIGELLARPLRPELAPL